TTTLLSSTNAYRLGGSPGHVESASDISVVVDVDSVTVEVEGDTASAGDVVVVDGSPDCRVSSGSGDASEQAATNTSIDSRRRTGRRIRERVLIRSRLERAVG
ncbi:MAG: hypothetical protein ACLFRT_14345, partial [Actinomycetota bacterium]